MTDSHGVPYAWRMPQSWRGFCAGVLWYSWDALEVVDMRLSTAKFLLRHPSFLSNTLAILAWQ